MTLKRSKVPLTKLVTLTVCVNEALSLLLLNCIVYEPAWKRCHFHLCLNIYEPLRFIYTKRQRQRCDNSAMTLAILFSLKSVELLQNGFATHFQATPLISMRTKLQASLQSCRSVDADADAWCKRTLRITPLNGHLPFTTKQFIVPLM